MFSCEIYHIRQSCWLVIFVDYLFEVGKKVADWKKIGQGISSGLGEASKKAGEVAQKKYDEFETKRIETNKKEAELELQRQKDEKRQKEIDAEKNKILNANREEEEKKSNIEAEKLEAALRKIQIYTVDISKDYSYVGFVQGYGQRKAAARKGDAQFGSNLENPISVRQAQEDSIREMKKAALKIGASAIIGCRTEVVKTSWKHSLTGQTSYTSSMYECFSNGTAVKF